MGRLGSTILLLSILACSAHTRFLSQDDPSELSFIVKRQAEEAVITTEVAVKQESLLDIFSTSTKEEKKSNIVIQSLHSVSNITFRYAKTLIESKILNPGDVAQEVFFSVIIPESAFISGFSMEIDGNVYNAYVKEKQEAQKVYNTAIKQGVTAGHVKQSARDSNRFSVSVNVEPSKKVRFNLTYEELLERKFGYYRHVVNINPGQLVDDLSIEINVHENRNITKFRVPQFQSGNEVYPVLDEIDFDLATTERISPTEVKAKFNPTIEDQKRLRKNVKQGQEVPSEELLGGMSGQFAFEYDVEREADGGEILVNEDGYFVHFFAPPELPPLKKHIVFVLDVSGSMEGRKIEQLKQAMNDILTELNPEDFFNIVEFAYSSVVRDLDSPELTAADNPWLVNNVKTNLTKSVKPFPATPEYIKKGKEIIEKMTAAGGTNIYDALNVAVKIAKDGVKSGIVKRSPEENKFLQPEPMIIFLTDGEPTVGETSDSKIIKNIDETNNDPRVPIFSLAFGSDADFRLLKRISLLTNGFVRQIYEAADTSIQLKNFYRQVSTPKLSKVKFIYPIEQVQNETITKHNFGTFFGGSELVVSGKLANDVTPVNNVLVEANSAEGVRNFSVTCIDHPIPVLKTEKKYGTLERLWVYMTIKDLLNEAEIMKARSYLLEYKEEAKPLEPRPEEKALRLALEYSFVTPLTSLVVVKPGSLSDVDLEPAVAKNGHQPSAPSPLLLSVLPLQSNQFMSPPGGPEGTRLSSHSRFSASGGMASTTRAFPTTGYDINTDTGMASAPHPPFGTNHWDTYFQSKVDVVEETTTDATLLLSDIVWLDQYRNGDFIRFPGDSTSTDYKLFPEEADEPHGNCTVASTGDAGQCRHLKYCILQEITQSVDTYYPNYFCLIPGNFAGICCPY